MSSNDRVVCTISSAKKRISTDNVWLLNLEMIEQQTGRIISRHYVEHDELLGSIVQFSVDNVLYSKLRPNLNKVVLPDCDGYATSELVPLKPNSAILCREYLAAYLRSDSFVAWAVSKTTGAKMPRLGTDVLLDKINTNLPLPPLDEQRRIAAMLDKVSDLIAKRRQQLEKLDELVKARFVEMFGEPGTDKFGWGLRKLGDCCEINPKKAQDKRLTLDVEVSFVPMPAVGERGEFDASDIRCYREVRTGFTYFRENDVLFAKITPCMENGKGAIAKGLRNGVGFGSTEFHVMRPVAGVSTSHWLYTMSVLCPFRIEAEANMTGSAGQRRVPASFLKGYLVALPPIERQESFEAFAVQEDKVKCSVQKNLRRLEALKKSLMQRYFE